LTENQCVTDAVVAKKLTLWDAIVDLGWFPSIYSTLVGGLSILAMIQQVVKTLRLSPALQWIIDGYNQVTRAMAYFIEPLLAPLLQWINATFSLQLQLYPHWRPLCLLALIFVVSGFRGSLLAGETFKAFSIGMPLGIGVVLGSLGAGLVPLDGSSKFQGLIAFLPIAGAFFAIGLAATAEAVIQRKWKDAAFIFCTAPLASGGYTLIGLGCVALLTWFVPSSKDYAAFVVLAVFIAVMGLAAVLTGLLENSIADARVGLTMLGGFVTATLVVIADWAIRAAL
jgi:hypothetical protein